MKQIVLLFLGSAIFSISIHQLLRMHRTHAVGKSRTSVPDDQKAVFDILSTLFRPTGTISLQVRLTDLFEIRPERGRHPLFKRLDGMLLDFLVADSATGRPLCGISLDDRLPREPDVERLFVSHDLPLLRIPREHRADSATFRATLARLNRPAPRHSPPRSGARESG